MSQRGSGNRGYGGGGSSGGGGRGGGGRGFSNGGGGNSGRGNSNSPRDFARSLPPMRKASKPLFPLTNEERSISGRWKDAEGGIFKPPTNNSVGVLKCRTIHVETNHIQAFVQSPDKIHHYEIGVKYGNKSTAEPETGKKRTDSGSKAEVKKPDLKTKGNRTTSAEPDPAKKRNDSGSKGQGQAEVKPKLWKKVVQASLPIIEARHKQKGGLKEMRVASDYSKALYSSCELRGTEESYIINSTDIDSSTSFIVTVTATKSVVDTKHFNSLVNILRGNEVPNMAELEQIFNIVVKTEAMHRFVNVGRSGFFNIQKENGEYSLGGGLVNRSGFSLICTFGWKTFINVDVANSVFIKGGKVMEIIQELFSAEFRNEDCYNVTTWSKRAISKVNELLKGCQISYTQPNQGQRTIYKRIEEVSSKSASNHCFEVEGVKTSVAQYFTKNGRRIELTNGPCLHIGKKDSNAVVPAEFCMIEKGQSYSKKLTDLQTAAMIKDTAKPPADRRLRIVEAIQACALNTDKVMREFGLKVPDPSLMQFPAARVLPVPEICYGANSEFQATVKDGVWNIWENSFKFVKPAVVKKWKILCVWTDRCKPYKKEDFGLTEFLKIFYGMFRQAGVVLPEFDGLDIIKFTEPYAFEMNMSEYFKTNAGVIGADLADEAFLMVIFPQKNHPSYSLIKKNAELGAHGVLTHCVAYQNIDKRQQATIGNIILKLNTKLGGVNHTVNLSMALPSSPVDFIRYPILVLGADVTHPSANSLMPSVAAVTASYDGYAMRYVMHPQVQKRADKNAAEVILGLENIVADMLTKFKKFNGIAARKIIYFRDGVGDGQYAEVLMKEMTALRAACDKASGTSGKYQPQITFISVQKRHKTRFFVKNSRDGIGKSNNAPPGTIIDTEITHPTEMDYFLLSHQGIQGTSRPTRYHLLWDDSNFKIDELQMLTYTLCQAYARCNRTVSIPAPTYYAHLAAYRVRLFIENMTPSEFENIAQLNEAVKRNVDLSTHYPMHFI